jgi:hypothetical protein
VKCDERKPRCLKCKNFGRSCVYGNLSQVSQAPESPAAPGNSGPGEVLTHSLETGRQLGPTKTGYGNIYTVLVDEGDPQAEKPKTAGVENPATQAEGSISMNSYVAGNRPSEEVGTGDGVAEKER